MPSLSPFPLLFHQYSTPEAETNLILKLRSQVELFQNKSLPDQQLRPFTLKTRVREEGPLVQLLALKSAISLTIKSHQQQQSKSQLEWLYLIMISIYKGGGVHYCYFVKGGGTFDYFYWEEGCRWAEKVGWLLLIIIWFFPTLVLMIHVFTTKMADKKRWFALFFGLDGYWY